MQKHDAKNAQGTSGTQQPQKKDDSGMDSKNQKQGQQQKGDRNTRTDDDFNSSPRTK